MVILDKSLLIGRLYLLGLGGGGGLAARALGALGGSLVDGGGGGGAGGGAGGGCDGLLLGRGLVGLAGFGSRGGGRGRSGLLLLNSPANGSEALPVVDVILARIWSMRWEILHVLDGRVTLAMFRSHFFPDDTSSSSHQLVNDVERNILPFEAEVCIVDQGEEEGASCCLSPRDVVVVQAAIEPRNSHADMSDEWLRINVSEGSVTVNRL